MNACAVAEGFAKISFQVYGVKVDGVSVLNTSVSRSRPIQLLWGHTPCIVAMETCTTSPDWGRMARPRGHELRIVPAIYVTPFVTRRQNDFVDAAAIAEVSSRLRSNQTIRWID